MKNIKIILLILAMGLLVCTQGIAQNLILQKDQAFRKKVFKPGKWLLIYTISEFAPENQDDNHHLYDGRLIASKADSIQLELFREATNIEAADESSGSYEFTKSEEPLKISIAKADILLIIPNKDFKKRVKQENRNLWGGILTFAGVLTAGNAFIAEGGESRERLLYTAGGLTGLGIVLATLNRERHFHTSKAFGERGNHRDEIWIIQ